MESHKLPNRQICNIYKFISLFLIPVYLFTQVFSPTSYVPLSSKQASTIKEDALRPASALVENNSSKKPPLLEIEKLLRNAAYVDVAPVDVSQVIALSEQQIEQLDRLNSWEKISFESSKYYNFYTYRFEGTSKTVFVVEPLYDMDMIWRDPCWQMRKVLHDKFTKLNTQQIFTVLTEANKRVLGPHATEDDVLRLFFLSTQNKFLQTTSRYLSGLEDYDYAKNQLDDKNYSHVGLFSWIYCKEITILQDVLKLSDRDVTVLDMATGFANFIFTAQELLTDNSARVKYIGSDISARDMGQAISYAKSKNTPAEFVFDDMTEPAWGKRFLSLNNNEKVDMVVVNHVLEHLDGNPVDYLIEWASVVNEALVISVPLEDAKETTISAHSHAFTAEALKGLGNELSLTSKGLLIIDYSQVFSGILIIMPKDSVLLSTRVEAINNFGEDIVDQIEGVYNDIWGRDAYRFKGVPSKGKRIDSSEILKALNDVYSENYIGRFVAKKIASALCYVRGTNNEEGYMNPADPEYIKDIAAAWIDNLRVIKNEKHVEANNLDIFAKVWANYSTHMHFRHAAETISGKSNCDSFNGILAKNVKPKDVEELTGSALMEYEKADIISLESTNTLMRKTSGEVEALLRSANYAELVHLTVLAILYGEGRFYQLVQLYLERFGSDELRGNFNSLVEIYVKNIEQKYHTTLPISQIDWIGLARKTEIFFNTARPLIIPEDFNFSAEEMLKRQKLMREAESYVEYVEKEFAKSDIGVDNIKDQEPADAYANAMLLFKERLLEVDSRESNLASALKEYRHNLIQCRKLADIRYGHGYHFWTGAGERLGQLKLSSTHSRYQLYHMEAYAERMFVTAQLAAKDPSYIQGEISLNQSYDNYLSRHEIPLYIQEWIAQYGPRRAAIFGFAGPDTIDENTNIIAADRKIREIVQLARERGANKGKWGLLATGYTEKLRYLIRDGDADFELADRILKALNEDGTVEVERAIALLNPYDGAGKIDNNNPSFVTIGVHIHNADPDVIYETLLHLREIDWPYLSKWPLMGTTSSKVLIAEREREIALELGITRYAMTARRHLKAGNQNRVMPNVPIAGDRESFYFTLDDDYVPAAQTMNRLIPGLLAQPLVSYSQVPLFFRGSVEPGHSTAKHSDANIIQGWSTGLYRALNDLGNLDNLDAGRQSEPLLFPSGTGTLFRLTPGKNSLASVGYICTETSGEDFATGALLHLKERTDIFVEDANEWKSGILVNEGWVIGDGVDYLGRTKQQIRWSEGGAYIGVHIWLKSILRSIWRTLSQKRSLKNAISRFSFKQVFMAFRLFFGFAIQAFVGFAFFIVVPATVIIMCNELIYPFISLLVTSFVLWFLPLLFIGYVFRHSGLTLFDLIEFSILHNIAAHFSLVKGTLRGLFRSSMTWQAFKGQPTKKSSIKQFIPYMALGLLNVAAGIAGVFGASNPIFAFLFFNALFFFLTIAFYKPTPKIERDKIIRMSKDARDTLTKRIFRYLSYGDRSSTSIKHDKNIKRFGVSLSILTSVYMIVASAWLLYMWSASTLPFGFFALFIIIAQWLGSSNQTIDRICIIRGIEILDYVDRLTPKAQAGYLVNQLEDICNNRAGEGTLGDELGHEIAKNVANETTAWQARIETKKTRSGLNRSKKSWIRKKVTFVSYLLLMLGAIFEFIDTSDGTMNQSETLDLIDIQPTMLPISKDAKSEDALKEASIGWADDRLHKNQVVIETPDVVKLADKSEKITSVALESYSRNSTVQKAHQKMPGEKVENGKTGKVMEVLQKDKTAKRINMALEGYSIGSTAQEMFLKMSAEKVENGEIKDAIKILQKAYKEMPKNIIIACKLAEILSWDNRLKESFKLYQNILRKEPDNFDANLGILRVTSYLGKIEYAELGYRQLLEKYPYDVRILNGLAEVLSWQAKYEESIKIYLKALEILPNNIKIIKAIAEVNSWDGNMDEAIKYYQQVLKLSPDNKEVKYRLADLQKRFIFTLDYGYQKTDFSTGNIIGLSLLYQPDLDDYWAFGIRQRSQYGMSEKLFALSYFHKFDLPLGVYVGAEYSPNAECFARFRANTAVTYSPFDKFDFSLGAGFADYGTTQTFDVYPSVTWSINPKTYLTGQFSYGKDSAGLVSTGYGLRLNRYIDYGNFYLSLSRGGQKYAIGKGILFDADITTYGAGFEKWITESFGLGFDMSYADSDGIDYPKFTVGAKLKWRFMTLSKELREQLEKYGLQSWQINEFMRYDKENERIRANLDIADVIASILGISKSQLLRKALFHEKLHNIISLLKVDLKKIERDLRGELSQDSLKVLIRVFQTEYSLHDNRAYEELTPEQLSEILEDIFVTYYTYKFMGEQAKAVDPLKEEDVAVKLFKQFSKQIEDVAKMYSLVISDASGDLVIISMHDIFTTAHGGSKEDQILRLKEIFKLSRLLGGSSRVSFDKSEKSNEKNILEKPANSSNHSASEPTFYKNRHDMLFNRAIQSAA